MAPGSSCPALPVSMGSVGVPGERGGVAEAAVAAEQVNVLDSPVLSLHSGGGGRQCRAPPGGWRREDGY
jgi:hypothetical protein